MLRARLLAAAAALVLLPGATLAQQPALQLGSWTGSIVPPNGQALSVVVEVATVGDSLAMTMRVLDFPDHSAVPFQDIKFTTEGKLLFNFDFIEHVGCVLVRVPESSSWSGTCAPSEGNPGTISLTPPKPGTAVR